MISQPRHEIVMRSAGRLTCGDLAIEPSLGIARVAAVRHDGPYVHLTWADDYGPSTATSRYPAGLVLPVRVPHPLDRLKIKRAIEQATWAKRAVRSDTAWLIAAHLNHGPGTALHRFTRDGAVTGALFEELEQVKRMPAWVDALARYCLDRDYKGPLSGWWPGRGNDEPAATQRPAPPSRRRRRPVLARKYMYTETAQRLIDAAFAMGLEACRDEIIAAKAKWIIRHYSAPETVCQHLHEQRQTG
ncbi:hypothetical protein [Micromonospora sp. CPCC 206061]|uniref:hypothetical protein n=1 Tax=Micromonospora sp. CPCC 206061 TaxID=3122410 RepID=UPI002FEE7165